MKQEWGYFFKSLFIILLATTLLTACSDYKSVILRAVREDSFPILLPNDEVDGWTIDDAVYEEELLAIRFVKNENGYIDLIHDQEIKGLDVLSLRDYVMTEKQLPNDQNNEIFEIEGYVGEILFYEEPFPTIQFTFVRKQNLIGSIDKIPLYQVIAKNTSLQEFLTFMKALKVAYS